MRSKSFVFTVAGATLASSFAHADLVDRWDVGSGDQTASLQFDFLSGDTFVFDVSWTGDLTGRAAFDIIAADDTGRFDFSFDYIAYSFGDFLTTVEIDGAFDTGTGTPPDYIDVWSYWTSDTPSGEWTSSFIGFSDRVLLDGARDAWVFGTGEEPAVVPAPGLVSAALVAGLMRRRRRS